jgi:hypothetical protein
MVLIKLSPVTIPKDSKAKLKATGLSWLELIYLSKRKGSVWAIKVKLASEGV